MGWRLRTSGPRSGETVADDKGSRFGVEVSRAGRRGGTRRCSGRRACAVWRRRRIVSTLALPELHRCAAERQSVLRPFARLPRVVLRAGGASAKRTAPRDPRVRRPRVRAEPRLPPVDGPRLRGAPRHGVRASPLPPHLADRRGRTGRTRRLPLLRPARPARQPRPRRAGRARLRLPLLPAGAAVLPREDRRSSLLSALADAAREPGPDQASGYAPSSKTAAPCRAALG